MKITSKLSFPPTMQLTKNHAPIYAHFVNYFHAPLQLQKLAQNAHFCAIRVYRK